MYDLTNHLINAYVALGRWLVRLSWRYILHGDLRRIEVFKAKWREDAQQHPPLVALTYLRMIED